MALLTIAERKKYFKTLGLGEYNEANIKKMQKRYMLRSSDADGIYGENSDNLLRHLMNCHLYLKAENFKPEEFRCGCNGRYCCGYPTYMKPAELMNVQSIRAHFGKPMTITCGVRCTRYNAEVGGIPLSEHKVGLAVDYYIADVTDTAANRQESMEWIKDLPNHHYTYGNGRFIETANGSISRGYVSAPGMGQALHTDSYDGTPGPAPKPTPPGKITVDGIVGTDTVKRAQVVFGTLQDGKISGQKKDLIQRYFPALIAVAYNNVRSTLVARIQTWAGCTSDGIWGEGTSLAVQKKLMSEGYDIGPWGADGCFGKSSAVAFQKWLNDHDEPTPDTPQRKSYLMIDVSEFQPSIDWAKVKAAGVKGVMVRCGGRGGESGKIYEDSKYIAYIKGAHAAGLPVGIYFLTQAITAAEGKAEAQYAIKQWTKAGIPISYPICIDSENVTWKNPDGSTGYGRANDRNLSKAKRTAAIKGFVDEIKRQGYTAMIYASTGWLNDQVDMSKLECDVWAAQYYSECQYKGKYIIWQYTSDGSVNGVKGVVDLNKCYIKAKAVDPPKPKPTPGGETYPGPYPEVVRTKQLIDMAVKLAWPKGTDEDVYEYPSGRATSAFKVALDKAYPEHNSWGAAPRVGASCDVFVGTVVRYVGIDGKFPRGLEQQFEYKPSWCLRYDYDGIAPASKSLDGDIVLFEYNGGAHAIIRGNGMYYEANYNTYFGHTNESLSRIRRRQNRTVVLRPKNYLAKGDTSPEVGKLQKYLIWGGWLAKGEDDSIFGAKTETAVLKMQEVLGVTQDGKVGEDTVKAMRAYKKK